MPGVPPDAMNTLKKAFKGLFKRGKKSKEDQSTPQSSQSAQPSTSASNAAPSQAAESTSTPTTSAAAPQLPPVQSSSPLQSPETEEPAQALPPTHPLATGPQSQPQEAIPINRDAAPAPPVGASDAAGTVPLAPVDTADLIREQEKSPHVVSDLPPRIPVDTSVPIGENSQTSQAADSAALDGVKDDLSPALQNSAATALPQTTNEHIGVLSPKESEPIAAPIKTDSAVEAPKVEDKPVTDASLPNPVGGQEASSSVPDTAAAQPATNGVSTTTATKSAPGMSATSGPLEDFPEGGDVQNEQHI